MSNEDDLFHPDLLYTERQAMILTIVPWITGTMSVMGSGIIIYVILSDRKRKLQRVYHRLLLGYSAIDFMTSTNLALSALVVPRGTEGVWGALGNVATCEASGFISQFLQSQGLYNSFMCLYMMLVVRYDVREASIKKWVEPLLHGYAILGPIVFGGVLLHQNLYNPAIIVVGWCFIAGAPGDCVRFPDEFACARGPNYAPWLTFLNVPYFFYTAIVIVSCIGTYLRVRQLDVRMSSWTFAGGSSMNTQNSDTSRRRRRAPVSKKTEDTFRQAVLYIGTFLVTYGFYGVNTTFGPADYTSATRAFYFPMTLLTKIFLPLQGAWNCFIFVLPRYCALRRRNPDATFLLLMNRIIFHSHQSAKKFTTEERQRHDDQRQRDKEQHHQRPAISEPSIDLVDEPDQDDFQPAIDNSDGTQSINRCEDENDSDEEDDVISAGKADKMDLVEGTPLAVEGQKADTNSQDELAMPQRLCAVTLAVDTANENSAVDERASNMDEETKEEIAMQQSSSRSSESEIAAFETSAVPIDAMRGRISRPRRQRRSIALLRSFVGLGDARFIPQSAEAEAIAAEQQTGEYNTSQHDVDTEENNAIQQFVLRTSQSQRISIEANDVPIQSTEDPSHRRQRRSIAFLRSIVGMGDGRRGSVNHQFGTPQVSARQSIAVMERTVPETENSSISRRNRRSIIFVEEVILGED